MIYLLRHGEIQQKEKGLMVGQTDLPLSEQGRGQARLWRDALARTRFAFIAASDLSRASQTARIIAGKQAETVRISPRLREIDLGEWDGRPKDQIKTAYPRLWALRGQALDRVRPPGGESFEDLQARVMPVFDKLIAPLQSDTAKKPANALIVAHAGVNRAILCQLLQMPLAHLFCLGQDYGGMNLIDPHRLQVISVNISPRWISGKPRKKRSPSRGYQGQMPTHCPPNKPKRSETPRKPVPG